MRVLILGGTGFIGRHMAEIALAAGHDVTLFNRGKSGPSLFPQAETLIGDRDGDLESLKGKKWDIAIDTASYFPRITRLSAEVLRDSVDRFVFISTMALYDDYTVLGLNEKSPVIKLEDPTTEIMGSDTYGGLKALCENVVDDVFGDRGLKIRPGIIIGPYDTTDRFTYWCQRIARGGRVLVPDCWDQPIQYIDVRDLMSWLLQMAVEGKSGVYNATGPEGTKPLSYLFNTLRDELCPEVEFVKADRDFMLESLERPIDDMPFFMPYSLRRGFLEIDSSKAQNEGLSYRSLARSARDTFEWQKELPANHPWQSGLSREREADLLRNWDSRARVV